MRCRGTFALLPVILISGCGYVSEPLPPALRRPTQVTDLAAVERGTKIIIQFTVPTVTTEDLPIKGEPDIELRIGPAPAGGFDPNVFGKSSDRITNIARRKPLAYVEVPVGKYAGQTVDIGLRVNGPGGRNAGWSNFIALQVVPPLPMPEDVAADNGPDSVRLTWRATAPEFRVFRKLVAEPSWTLAGSVTTPSYTDANIEYGKTYQYFVQSVQKAGEAYAESEISVTTTFKPEDHFPPAVPAGLTAIPAIRSIELVWQRDTEKDLAFYTVYRNGEKIATSLTAPAYSDAQARQGVQYQYQLTATDTAGNESGKSTVVPAVIP
jgi:hypothetical protein